MRLVATKSVKFDTSLSIITDEYVALLAPFATDRNFASFYVLEHCYNSQDAAKTKRFLKAETEGKS